MNIKDPQLPKFIHKLLLILEDQNNHSIIDFNETGRTIIVHDELLFQSDILPKYFKHTNFHSFTRQLNNYGFKRLRNRNNKYEFRNSCFQKDNGKLLTLVSKKDKQKNSFLTSFSTLLHELRKFNQELDQFKYFLHSFTESSDQLKLCQTKIRQELKEIQHLNSKRDKLINIFNNHDNKQFIKFSQ